MLGVAVSAFTEEATLFFFERDVYNDTLIRKQQIRYQSAENLGGLIWKR